MKAITKFGGIIPFLEELKQKEDDSIFFAPISEGKWSTAAVVAHLFFWDQYIQNSRLPQMLTNESVPAGQVDVQKINNDANTFAHSGFSKNELINRFITNRKNFLEELAKIDLEKSFSIGEQDFTIETYFLGMVEHDEHHMQQIKQIYEGS